MSVSRVPPVRRPRVVSPRALGVVAGQIPVVVGQRGVAVSRRGSAVAVSPADPPTITRQTFYGKITGRSSVGPNRWEYTFVEVLKTALGATGWTNRPGGREGKCYNYVEVPNDGEGEEGNGINLDDLPAGFGLGPIAIGRILKLEMVRTTVQEQLEAWFAADNPVVGRCPP